MIFSQYEERPLPKVLTHLGKPWDPSMMDGRPGGGSTCGPHFRIGYDQCRRAGAFRYHFHRRLRRDKEHRILGSLVHLALAYYYGARLDKKPAWIKDPQEDYAAEIMAGVDTAHRQIYKEKVAKCVKAYARRFAGESLKPMGVEREIVATIGEIDPGGPWPELDSEIVTARMDLDGFINGKIDVIDFKCTGGNRQKGSLGAFDRLEWETNRQFREILLIMRARYATPVRGIVIRQIMREPPFDFRDEPITIPAAFYAMTGRQMRISMKRIINLQAALRKGEPLPYDGALTDHCSKGAWGPCDYLAVCSQKTPRDQLVMLKSIAKSKGEVLYDRSQTD